MGDIEAKYGQTMKKHEKTTLSKTCFFRFATSLAPHMGDIEAKYGQTMKKPVRTPHGKVQRGSDSAW